MYKCILPVYYFIACYLSIDTEIIGNKLLRSYARNIPNKIE